MNTSVKTGIVVVLVVAASLVGTRALGWWGGEPTKPTPIALPKPGSGSAPRAPIQPASADPTVMGRLPELGHDDDPVGAIRLEGQVIDEHDQPVGGARVAIDANPPKLATTEADGSFAFEGLIARDYRIEATLTTDTIGRYAGPVRVRLHPDPEPVTLRMKEGGTVDVAVSDAATGAPVAGAQVELRSTLVWSATTTAAGMASLRGVGAVWAPLAVRAPGYAPAAMLLSTSGDPRAPVSVALKLARGAAITGTVVDEAGAPVGGARVVPTNASEPFPVVDARRDGVDSRPDGSFTLPAVSAGTWRLTATQGVHAPATSAPITVDGVHPRDGVKLVVVAGGVVTGTVVDQTGAPVAAADVRVVVRGHTFWRAQRQAFTGADGTFTIGGLPRRAVDVVASHASGASAIASLELDKTRDGTVTLKLDLVGAIDGVVVDTAGQPIGDAQVIAEPEFDGGITDRQAWSVRGVAQTVTDQGGAFRFPGLPAGTYRVRAARPGAAEVALDLAKSTIAKPGDKLKLVVPADGKIVGKVVMADGKPPTSFSVSLAGGYATPFATADGAFALPAVAGTHTLVVDGKSFLTARSKDVTVTEGKPTDVGTITVQPGRSISGRVVDETGTPVAGAKVAVGTLLTGGGTELYIADESINAKDTDTDAQGRFVLDGFPPTSLTAIAGKADVRSASVRLPASADSSTLVLVLQKTTGLGGKITRDGKPLGDTIVLASPIGASSTFFVATGPDGTFALDALAAGPYIVYPMIGGGGSRPKDLYVRRVDVAAGARAHVEIDATAGATTLTVHAKQGGAPVPMAMVVAVGAKVSPHTAEELRAIDQFAFGDTPTPLHMRMLVAGTVDIEGVRAGVLTVCVAAGSPADDPATVPVTCVPVTVGTAPKQAVDVTLPATKP